MQNFMKACGERSYLLLFFFYVISITGMENPSGRRSSIVGDKNILKPTKTITIFDPKKESNSGRSWCEVVPGNIMITPDDKGVVIGTALGQVYSYQFPKKEQNSDVEVIIEHAHVRHSPMIAMAERKDKSLLIVSAGNYPNSEKNMISEYIVYSNGSYKCHKLNWPIQAIALDRSGETLAIAGLQSVFVIDFATQNSNTVHIRKKFNEDNWVVGIDVNAKGSVIIAVGSLGGIQWVSLDKKRNEVLEDFSINLETLKTVRSGDIITKIYYPAPQQLLYLTLDGQAKIVEAMDVLGNNDVDAVESTIFPALLPQFEQVAANPHGYIATAHWTQSPTVSEEIRQKIKVYRKGDTCIDEFILEELGLEGRYTYITPQGQRALGVGKWLNVALNGRHVVALGSDGKMRLWVLPERNAMYDLWTEEEKAERLEQEKLAALKAAASHVCELNKKTSDKTKRFSKAMDSEEKQKKISPLFKGLMRSSRDNSPAQSRENSPTRTTEKNSASSEKNVTAPHSPRSGKIGHSPRFDSAPVFKRGSKGSEDK